MCSSDLAGLAKFKPGCLERMTDRQIATTDNFLRPVDYGDSALVMTPALSMSARLLGSQNDGVYRWFDEAGFQRQPHAIQGPLSEYPGLAMHASRTKPLAGVWELQPIDEEFLRWQAPTFELSRAFDKLAFRTGWSDDDQYVLLEGVGGKPNHAHREANGIVRLNHRGRHWIVSNGYGRRAGLTNVTQSFTSRQIGPEDHNLLVLRRAGQVVTDQPMVTLLQHGANDNVLHATTALLNYSGVDWFRTLVIVAGQYAVVIDRVQIIEDGLEKAHIEWNCLGSPSAVPAGYRLEQQRVFMDVTSISSGWSSARREADQSGCWLNVLGSGAYPFARFPLQKLVYELPSVARGQAHFLVTLLSAHHGQPTHELTPSQPGQVTVKGEQGVTRTVRLVDQDLSLEVNATACVIGFGKIPLAPAMGAV